MGALIGTCVESSRRQDKQAELLLAIARFAANLSDDSVIYSLIFAAVRWFDNRTSMVRVWVLRTPSANRHDLILHSTCTVSSASDIKHDRQEGEIIVYKILSNTVSQQTGKHALPSSCQPSKFVLRCFAKHEMVHAKCKDRSESTSTSTAEAVQHHCHGNSMENTDAHEIGESIDIGELLCLPILFSTKDCSQSSSCDGTERVWGVFEVQAVPGQMFTTLDISLMSNAAVHAGTCLAHAEAKTDSEATIAATSKLFQRSNEIFSCKSTLALFKTTCKIAHQVLTAAHHIVDNQYISLFALDSEGRQVQSCFCSERFVL